MDNEIILMRHGRPDLAPAGKVSAREMKCWIEQYELSEITQHPAPAASRALAARAKVIITSNAPRALTSVRALGLQPAVVDAMFGEAQLPHGRWRQPRLSPFTWAFALRLAWLCGLSEGVESFRQARLRADTASQRLRSLAGQGPVLLLGHGFMNRLIAQQLTSAGWTRVEDRGNGYWGAKVYRKRL
ncbi:histidine phosphatase family protein [Comamonas sp.]|uniref:histidine phosphatase family protein n=1 Tax=Comamonas sp. TaxID=34028 RepID=UPI0012C3A043|nr:histidine phosphatase family protein [Comamonas sp.]MPS93264.1 histidine phosphatase family protein [Comamonas sp.]